MRGRQGKSLIIAGIILVVIGGVIAWAGTRGGGHYITVTPIVVGIIAIVRGISQTRRGNVGNVGYGGPGQGIPPAGYGYQQPAGYSPQNPDAHRAYDQPGYAVPHHGAPAQAQGQGAGGTQGQPGPNWYPDPQNQAMMRWWDGQAWTPHTQPRA